MKRNFVFVISTILFLTTFASAQFGKLKIPKISKGKIPKIGKKTSRGVESLSGSNGKNRQMIIDDGFTFFEATPVKKYVKKYSGYIAKGWTLTSYLRAFGTYPDQSSFKIIVSKNGKALAKYSCETKIRRKAGNPVRSIRNSPDDDSMWTLPGGYCGRDKDIFVRRAGKYDVKVFAVNGDNDEETLLRTYKIDVREAKKTRPGRLPGVSDFYIQRYAEAPVAILYLRPSEGSGSLKHDYYERGGGGTLNGNIDIYFNISMATSSMAFKGIPYVRCFQNGKRVKFLNQGDVKEGWMRSETAKYERDGKAPIHIGFYTYRISIPVRWKASRSGGNPDMSRLPGEWKCQLRNKTETVRTFRWTVGSNGYPQEHPEQTSGNVNLHWGAYLVDVKIPEGGSTLDGRLLPIPNAGLFYGIPWKSAEGKKMAAGVPKKGKPFLMP